jgi:hypothetical protein
MQRRSLAWAGALPEISDRLQRGSLPEELGAELRCIGRHVQREHFAWRDARLFGVTLDHC